MRTRQTKPFFSLKPALLPSIRYRRELQGAVIFDAASLGIYATNTTGFLILKTVNGKTSCADIVDQLEHRFVSTSRRTLQRDLRCFLEDLASLGLVHFEP